MYNLVVLLLVFSGILTSFMVVNALRKSRSPIAIIFAIFMACGTIWNLGFVAEIISPTLESKLFWANIQFTGIVFLPIAWLTLSLLATGKSLNSLKSLAWINIIAVISLVVIWTDPYHHLFRGTPSLLTSNVPFPILHNDYGIFYYAISVPLTYVLFTISYFILVEFYIKAPEIYRRQSLILMLSVAIPLITDFFYVIDVTPIPYFNFTCIFFSLSGILLNFSIEKNHFLDIRPLAFETAINAMDIGVIVIDSSNRITYLNPAIETITGDSNNLNISKDATQIFPELAHVFNSDIRKGEITRTQNQLEYDYEFQRSYIHQKNYQTVGQIITLHDITEKTKLLKMTEKLSLTDTLTNALNRRALILQGDQEIQRANRYQRELSIILLDVDNFKKINDTHGHLGGDKILKEIVQKIQKIIRHNDFIFRYGGDEFVILLIETDLDQAYQTAERIRNELAEIAQIQTQANQTPISISLGITQLLPQDTLESFIQRADQALYQSKSAGKNQTTIK